jgi:hypothetical protein
METTAANMRVSVLRLFFKILAHALVSEVSIGRDPAQPPLYWTSLVQVTIKEGRGATNHVWLRQFDVLNIHIKYYKIILNGHGY